MIKNICTVILLLLSVLPAAGQNRVKVKISGNVITTDGAPAEYITVSLKNTVFGGMSDGDGNFEFAAPPGEYTMVVQSVTAHRKEFPVTIETGRETYSRTSKSRKISTSWRRWSSPDSSRRNP